jgi:dimeric dUTPase (all-alpha-NTP-PPase superfamily)
MNKVNPDNACSQLIKSYEYRKDALQYMFNMQQNLQEFIASKKGGLPPGKGDFREEIDLAIYYFGCTTTEFFEFGERLNDFEWDWSAIGPDDKLEIQYEYIDMWHFIMNQFLYTGITGLDIDLILEDVYKIKTSLSIDDQQNDLLLSTQKLWSNFSFIWGSYLNNLPYKKWKKYNDNAMDDVDKERQLTLAIVMIRRFIQFGKIIDIDAQHFYNLYVSKNEENISRQEAGGVYHSD